MFLLTTGGECSRKNVFLVTDLMQNHDTGFRHVNIVSWNKAIVYIARKHCLANGCGFECNA